MNSAEVNISLRRIVDKCGCTDTSCDGCREPDNCRNCVDCCCTESHKKWRRSTIRTGLLIQYFNNLWMAVEVTVALVAGIAATNFALLAFGSDSVIELASGFVVLMHLRRDGAGAEGTGESASKFSRLLLMFLIPVIGGGAVYSYIAGVRPETSLPGLVVAAVAVAIMPFFWLEKRKIGKSTNCVPLKVDAMESATCFIMSIVLLAGLALQYLFDAYWVVYLATAILLAFIGKEAVKAH